ncbi:Protein FAR1-RELATED SEQUENCE 5 [Linum perenne]
MVVKLNSDNSTWRVHEFKKQHTHDMVVKEQQRYMTNHRGISDVAGNLINSRLDAGMRPAQIMKLAVHEAGGHKNVGYVDTDIYNFAYKNRTQQINGGDAANALTYLNSRKDEDKEFFLENTENDEGQLMNLFWADSISRTDYACFGDLLLFDTTYKKNHYNIPFVIFSAMATNNIECRMYEACHLEVDMAVMIQANNIADMVNEFYDLATSFHKFGWGESFHFAHRQLGMVVTQNGSTRVWCLGVMSGKAVASPEAISNRNVSHLVLWCSPYVIQLIDLLLQLCAAVSGN